MHGMENIKFINAQLAKQIYHFKNIKAKGCSVLNILLWTYDHSVYVLVNSKKK
jgi:hypothetical protein